MLRLQRGFPTTSAHKKLEDTIRSGVRFVHSDNIAELRSSADRGCPLCAVFLKALESGERGSFWFQEYHSPLPEEGATNIRQDWLRRMEDLTRVKISVGKHMSDIQPSLQLVPLNGLFHFNQSGWRGLM